MTRLRTRYVPSSHIHSIQELMSQRPPPRSADDKWVHDAYPGAGRRDRGERGERVAGRPGPAAFVGSSPCVEVSGLHYEVTAADLKVGVYCTLGLTVDHFFPGRHHCRGPHHPCKRLTQFPTQMKWSKCARHPYVVTRPLWQECNRRQTVSRGDRKLGGWLEHLHMREQ